MARTATAPVPATRDALLRAMAALPMPTPHGERADYVVVPAVEVGSIVMVHAQGKVRGVVVTKVGPKRAQVEWATPTSWARDMEWATQEEGSYRAAGNTREAYLAAAHAKAVERFAYLTDADRRTQVIEREDADAERLVTRVLARRAAGGEITPSTVGKSVPLTECYAPIASAITA